MFKGRMDKAGEVPIVMLGLSHANITKLKQDNPIVFNLDELGLPELTIVISYKHPDGRACLPKAFEGIALCLGDEVLKDLRRGHVHEMKTSDHHFAFIAAKTEQDIMKIIRKSGMIKPHTIQRTTGYAPSDVPPQEN